MVDPLTSQGNPPKNNGDSIVLDTREEIIARLKPIVQWVSAQEGGHNLAVELDLLIYKLETLALQSSQLASVTRERDAAWADINRIRTIVNNTLLVLDNDGEVREITSGEGRHTQDGIS